MATWPSELKVNRNNYSETRPDRVTRTEMDTGIDKVRKRFSNGVTPANFMLFLTEEQTYVLDEFYDDNEALRFDFPNPRTGETVVARFTDPPKYNAKETMWSVAVSVEILP